MILSTGAATWAQVGTTFFFVLQPIGIFEAMYERESKLKDDEQTSA